MRVAVFGLGAAGTRLARELAALGCEVVPVHRGDEPPRAVDAAVIATPTSAHREGLEWAVEAGVHAYVEKPLADRSEGIRELLDEADARGLVVAVGYNLRFHPAIEAIHAAVSAGRLGRLLSARAEAGQYLPDWHPGEDYRSSYAARAAGGGGALLTLSHELDYVRWIAGEVVECHGFAARVSDLDLDVDDVAELALRHENGAISSVHVDMLDRSYNRRSRWIGTEATIEWSWSQPALLRPAGEELWRPDGAALELTYRRALDDFLGAIRERRPARATGRDGLRVLRLIEELHAR